MHANWEDTAAMGEATRSVTSSINVFPLENPNFYLFFQAEEWQKYEGSANMYVGVRDGALAQDPWESDYIRRREDEEPHIGIYQLDLEETTRLHVFPKEMSSFTRELDLLQRIWFGDSVFSSPISVDCRRSRNAQNSVPRVWLGRTD